MAIQRVLMTDSRKEDVFYEEAIKTLRTNMQFSGVETKSIVITSCYPNEGKSDVTFQLAVEIGKMGKKVLIIDADIRKSNYVKRFQVEQKVDGLSQYLSGQVNKEKILYSTNYSNVDFIIPDSSYRKVTSKELKSLSSYELAVARNEIYARHGYIFVSNEWKDFFVGRYWYTPTSKDVTLNSVEEYNVSMILKEEATR